MKKRDAATVVIAGTATVGLVARGVAAKMVETTTTTTGTGLAVMVEARKGHQVLAGAQDPAKGVAMVATIGAVAAALAVTLEGRGTAQVVVQRGKACPLLPARLRLRVRTFARLPW